MAEALVCNASGEVLVVAETTLPDDWSRHRGVTVHDVDSAALVRPGQHMRANGIYRAATAQERADFPGKRPTWWETT